MMPDQKHNVAIPVDMGSTETAVLPPGLCEISPDGREIVLEQVNERSDIVLLEVPGEH